MLGPKNELLGLKIVEARLLQAVCLETVVVINVYYFRTWKSRFTHVYYFPTFAILNKLWTVSVKITVMQNVYRKRSNCCWQNRPNGGFCIYVYLGLLLIQFTQNIKHCDVSDVSTSKTCKERVTFFIHVYNRLLFVSTLTTFVAIVDPETCISFLFDRCRYLSIFRILLLSNWLGLNLKIRHGTKIGNIVANQ